MCWLFIPMTLLLRDAQSFAELFTAYTNQAYANSQVNQRIWLVVRLSSLSTVRRVF